MRLRLAGLAVLAVAASVITVPAAQAAGTVDMAAVVLAAQLDPRKPDETPTQGAKASVLLVEQALQAKSLLDATYVDGHFGTKTVEAYTAWQRSLGYSGLDASGLPGRTSLRELGTGRYTVTNELTPGARVSFRGVTVNERTKAMLLTVEGLLGRQFALTQGSYNPGGDPTSAGTHDGGGVVDISVSGMSQTAQTTAVRRLREVGFAAWRRTPSQGDWGYHIHAVAVSDTDLSSQAQHQVGDYYLGQNGLANRGPDDGPQVTKVTWEEYQQAH
jgi:hypothetical protein